MYREMSIEDKIGPFNPNLPVLNISECDHVVRMNGGSKDGLKIKSSTSIKHIRNRKKSRSDSVIKTLKTQNKSKGKEKRKKLKKQRIDSQHPEPVNQNNGGTTVDSDDESGRIIARNVEELLSDDSFSPRYKEKHATDMLMVFNRNDSTSCSTLEKEAIEQYENVDDTSDMNFNLLEIQARQQYEM